ncbi:substrate-binding domain-containing protein [Colwellia sp. 75C3]|uniref:substrate-binding domain-containing protein n=1 Tax=Colwellia sp. 75C3 TaxID=888425 RepID=UPI001E5F2549|nr:phosphate ABC transporter substrate-binding/OmpA family protein [Colwellia sp. 75C3]
MEIIFSGSWQANNQPLMTKLAQLARIAQNEFDIEISTEKMLLEEDYRLLVISELTLLAHQDISQITSWLTAIDERPSKRIEAEVITSNKRPLKVLLTLTLLIVAASIFWYSNTLQSFNSPSQAQVTNATIDTSINNTVKSSTARNPLQPLPSANTTIKTIVKSESETVFRLHGSNTIGEKLAPLLLEGFLKKQNINNFTWTRNTPLERVLHYSVADKNYAIELKSHGSSTAFSALKNKTADIGMSSRRIKASEVKQLSNTSGHLNKLGNEHIIGLDGLAVIVNQNNSVKQLSSKTLAKIFSGEINNWSQIGGASLPIELYARDQHSGTWDTFKNLVLKKHGKKLSQQAKRFESSSELSTLVSQNEAAIGFIGLNYVSHNKAIAISASKGTSAIFPTRFTVGTEDYALSRRLYFYTPTSASNLVKDFAQYALSTQGQQVVSQAGLISQNIKLEQVYPLADAPKKYQHYASTAKRLSLNFRFDYATKDLDNKGKRDLLRLVDFMEDHQSRRIVLMGFSDSIGAQLKNSSLSYKRAKSVELALTSRGIPVLAVEGMGEALPIANNNTDDGRKRNRRVEVWML